MSNLTSTKVPSLNCQVPLELASPIPRQSAREVMDLVSWIKFGIDEDRLRRHPRHGDALELALDQVVILILGLEGRTGERQGCSPSNSRSQYHACWRL